MNISLLNPAVQVNNVNGCNGRVGQTITFTKFGKDSTGHPTMRGHQGVVQSIDGEWVEVRVGTDLHRINALSVDQWRTRVRRGRLQDGRQGIIVTVEPDLVAGAASPIR